MEAMAIAQQEDNEVYNKMMRDLLLTIGKTGDISRSELKQQRGSRVWIVSKVPFRKPLPKQNIIENQR